MSQEARQVGSWKPSSAWRRNERSATFADQEDREETMEIEKRKSHIPHSWVVWLTESLDTLACVVSANIMLLVSGCTDSFGPAIYRPSIQLPDTYLDESCLLCGE